MTRDYVDSGVLIAAYRLDGESSLRARAVLEDPAREFVCSEFVRLEVLPKARFYGNTAEELFYEEFFARVIQWARPGARLLQVARREAEAAGLAAMDALHVAAARSVGAEELVTTERAGKPIHRVSSIVIVSIHPSLSR